MRHLADFTVSGDADPPSLYESFTIFIELIRFSIVLRMDFKNILSFELIFIAI